MICIIHRVPINDEIGANILAYLEDTSDFIHRHILKGHLVPVHCQMGISRSATVVIALYLDLIAFLPICELVIHEKTGLKIKFTVVVLCYSILSNVNCMCSSVFV
jgi:hypothetical protein